MGERQKTWRRFVTPQVILLALTILVGLIVLLASMLAGLFSPLEQAVIAIISGLAGAQLANNYSAIKQETRLELHERTQQEILHFWDDTVWVNYEGLRVLEDDIVHIWGRVKGRREYTALLGQQIVIPEITAVILEIE